MYAAGPVERPFHRPRVVVRRDRTLAGKIPQTFQQRPLVERLARASRGRGTKPTGRSRHDGIEGASERRQHACEWRAACLLAPDRAARLVEQHAIDPRLPGVEEVIDSLLSAVFTAPAANPYQAEIARAVQRVAVDQLMSLAASAPMPQVRALATERLTRKMNQLTGVVPANDGDRAHGMLLAQDIKRFLDRPYAAYAPVPTVEPVRGDPIGDSGMEFFRRYDFERRCDWIDNGRWATETCQP